VGIKNEEERDFTLKMPETFPDAAKAGKDVHFKIKVLDVRREKLSELNDEFADKVSPGSGGIEKLREAVKSDLQMRAKETENKAFEDRVIDSLVEQSQIKYPPLLVDSEVDRLIQEYVDRLRNTSKDEEEFKSVLKMSSEEKLRESFRPQAEQRVKRNLVISKIIEVENVNADDSEVDLQIAAITADAGTKLPEQMTYLNKPENRDTLRWWVRTNKARKLLVQKAQSE